MSNTDRTVENAAVRASRVGHEVGHLARKLGTFMQLSQDEQSCLAELQSEPVRVKRGKELVHEGQSGHKAYILQSGWACSFTTRPAVREDAKAWFCHGDVRAA